MIKCCIKPLHYLGCGGTFTKMWNVCCKPQRYAYLEAAQGQEPVVINKTSEHLFIITYILMHSEG